MIGPNLAYRKSWIAITVVSSADKVDYRPLLTVLPDRAASTNHESGLARIVG